MTSRIWLLALACSVMNGCVLIDPNPDDSCFAYVQPVSDASSVVGEWRLSFLAISNRGGEQMRCITAAESERDVRLVFRNDGRFERWEDGLLTTTVASYSVNGGTVNAAGRSYQLRSDSRLVHDLSPMDGPVYVFARQPVGSN